MHFDYEDIKEFQRRQGGGDVRLYLGESDSAWNPASTKRVIRGPATITYRLWPDGGVDAKLEDPPSVSRPDVLVNGL